MTRIITIIIFSVFSLAAQAQEVFSWASIGGNAYRAGLEQLDFGYTYQLGAMRTLHIAGEYLNGHAGGGLGYWARTTEEGTSRSSSVFLQAGLNDGFGWWVSGKVSYLWQEKAWAWGGNVFLPINTGAKFTGAVGGDFGLVGGSGYISPQLYLVFKLK